MIVCPWCAAKYEQPRSECADCGGRMPGAGAPPPPPRTLPAGFRRRVLLTGNVETLIGVIFTLVGAPILVIGLVTAVLGEPILFAMAAFGAIFFSIGFFLFRKGWRRGHDTLAAFERGLAAVGRIRSVYVDTSVKINNRSPWAIEYAFDAGGRSCEGKARTWDDEAGHRQAGEEIHVLYLEEDPSRNTVYPPVR